MPPKKYLVTLRVPSKHLGQLPLFAKPQKTPAAKVAKKKTQNSPQPLDLASSNGNNYKINSGLKESSTSGLVMNTNLNARLDKSGKPVRRWKKGSFAFKTFSGHRVSFAQWTA